MTDTLSLTPHEEVRVRRHEPSALEVEVTWTPGGSKPPGHFHPEQSERFEVLAGTLVARVGATEHRLGPGDTLDIPAGAVHQMWSTGDEPARAIWETVPAGRTLDWFEALSGLGPKPSPMAFAPLLHEYRDVFRLAQRPRSVVRLALAVVATLALVLPAAAQAATPGQKTARFVAYVEGKQVTDWNVPRYLSGGDCQGQRFTEAGGREAIRFRTRPFKLLAYMNNGYGPFVKIGTWDMFEASRIFQKSKGTIERTGRLVYSIDPGECHDAGDPTSQDTGPYDCGRRAYNPSLTINWTGSEVNLDAVSRITAPFDNCPIEGPLDPEEGTYTDISQEFPAKDVFNRSLGLHEVLGRKQWTEKIHRDHGTATTTTTFKLRLRRAGR